MLSTLQYTPTEGYGLRPVPTPEVLPYGWRYRLQTQPDGTEYYVEIPLTEEDLLDPQEGDRKMQKSKHARCAVAIFDRLDNYYIDDFTTSVFFDLKMEWGIPGLKEPAPDIAVVPQLREKDPDLGTFKVQEQGTQPALVIEVMSPHYQGDDTVKVTLYQTAGVKEYLIVNPYHGNHRDHYHLTLYRLVGQRYQAVKPDKNGRLFSETTGVSFTVSANGHEVILTVATTGEKLLTAKEEKQARLEVEAKLQALQARLRELEETPKTARRRTKS
jgi:Uma2 family endonuclease